MNDVLDDYDPLWAESSGGEGHQGEEWSDADADLAQRLYASLSGNTKQILDALLDRTCSSRTRPRRPVSWSSRHLSCNAIRLGAIRPETPSWRHRPTCRDGCAASSLGTVAASRSTDRMCA
jgi:hypothetical protein